MNGQLPFLVQTFTTIRLAPARTGLIRSTSKRRTAIVVACGQLWKGFMSADGKALGSGATTSNASSQELLRRARSGDSGATNRLFAKYLPTLHRWAHRRIPQWARGTLETADLVHDAALQTFRHLKGFEPQADQALLRYLRRSLQNRIRDQFRLALRRPPPVQLDEYVDDQHESPLDVTVNHENRQRYLLALKRLPADERNAIVARLELGYSYDQLALVLQKSTAQAARLAVRRALLRLARELEHV
jgi:RNA polymerase sigma-70 factor (ECF subfamily)